MKRASVFGVFWILKWLEDLKSCENSYKFSRWIILQRESNICSDRYILYLFSNLCILNDGYLSTNEPVRVLEQHHGIIFVYDRSNRESFKQLRKWISFAEMHNTKDPVYMVIGFSGARFLNFSQAVTIVLIWSPLGAFKVTFSWNA